MRRQTKPRGLSHNALSLLEKYCTRGLSYVINPKYMFTADLLTVQVNNVKCIDTQSVRKNYARHSQKFRNFSV
jgi:hypothetical protein